MADTITPSWDSIVMETTKPEKSSSLRVRVFVPKGTKNAIRCFPRRVKTEGRSQRTVYQRDPKNVSSVSCELGDSVAFQTIHLTQGYVQSATTFYIGGEVTVRFKGEEEGVHQAYIRLSSKGAAEVYIPMAVLCRKATAIDEAQKRK